MAKDRRGPPRVPDIAVDRVIIALEEVVHGVLGEFDGDRVELLRNSSPILRLGDWKSKCTRLIVDLVVPQTVRGGALQVIVAVEAEVYAIHAARGSARHRIDHHVMSRHRPCQIRQHSRQSGRNSCVNKDASCWRR